MLKGVSGWLLGGGSRATDCTRGNLQTRIASGHQGSGDSKWGKRSNTLQPPEFLLFFVTLFFVGSRDTLSDCRVLACMFLVLCLVDRPSTAEAAGRSRCTRKVLERRLNVLDFLAATLSLDLVVPARKTRRDKHLALLRIGGGGNTQTLKS